MASDVKGVEEAAEAVDGLLTEAEIQFLMLATIDGSETGIATEDEMKIVLDWANGVRLDESLLRLVMDGKLSVSVKDGEVAFMDAAKHCQARLSEGEG